ncbi:MAG: hypothetical protein DSY82_07545 [Flavobacteriia bacterium]|nr:MAG: hypothetical protein DSY82_07545 [Flavobacteriia bacterium]
MQLKIVPSFLMLLVYFSLYAQEATEIYLFDLIQTEDSYELTNPKNISDNPGYDNQPSFTEDGGSILYTSIRDGQADIVLYDIGLNFKTWITDTPEDEYSPKPYPKKKKNYTCVRKEKNGTQLLYKYAFKNNKPEVLLPNIQVAYYTWFDDKILITYIIDEDTEILQVDNFKYKLKYMLQFKIGRSFQRVPGTDLISYISKSHETPEIYVINPNNSEKKYIIDAFEGSEDMVWTNEGTILMGLGNKMFKYNPKTDKNWDEIKIISDLPVEDISRLAVSPDGKKIAVVVAEVKKEE